MRAVIQLVQRGSVTVDTTVVGSIGHGLVILLGIKATDTHKERDYLIKKILNMRIFNDASGKKNFNIQESNGEILLISQFTLYADCSRGNRPSFSEGMAYAQADVFFQETVAAFKQAYPKIQTGIFGADMKVDLINDGPITIVLDV